MWYYLQNGEGVLHPEGKRCGAVFETGEEPGVSLGLVLDARSGLTERVNVSFVKPCLRRTRRVYEGLCLWGRETLICELKQPLLGVSPERADTARLPPLPGSESKLWLLHRCQPGV